MSNTKIKNTIDHLRSFKTVYLMSDKDEFIERFKIMTDGVEDLLDGIYSKDPKTNCLASYLFDQLTENEKKEVERIMSDEYNTDLDIKSLTAIYYDFKGVYK